MAFGDIVTTGADEPWKISAKRLPGTQYRCRKPLHQAGWRDQTVILLTSLLHEGNVKVPPH
jgi:hypothetical protein